MNGDKEIIEIRGNEVYKTQIDITDDGYAIHLRLKEDAKRFDVDSIDITVPVQMRGGYRDSKRMTVPNFNTLIIKNNRAYFF